MKHKIVEISVDSLPQYYDPSYGVTYSSEMDIQNKALAGFLIDSNEPIDIYNLQLKEKTQRLYYIFFRKCTEGELEIIIE